MSLPVSLLDGPYSEVLDVGAFRGDFAKACLEAWPNCKVTSFEPLEPPPPEVAQHNRWQWYPVALGPSRQQRTTMYRSSFIPSSSFLEMAQLHKDAFPYTKRNDLVEVPMFRLDQMIEILREPALLKIDVQGYELEVLKGALKLFDQIDAVVLEVSHAELYKDAPNEQELILFLAAHGLKHKRRVDEMPHPQTKELLQSDEFFART